MGSEKKVWVVHRDDPCGYSVDVFVSEDDALVSLKDDILSHLEGLGYDVNAEGEDDGIYKLISEASPCDALRHYEEEISCFGGDAFHDTYFWITEQRLW